MPFFPESHREARVYRQGLSNRSIPCWRVKAKRKRRPGHALPQKRMCSFFSKKNIWVCVLYWAAAHTRAEMGPKNCRLFFLLPSAMSRLFDLPSFFSL